MRNTINQKWWLVVAALGIIWLAISVLKPYFAGVTLINPVLLSWGHWQIHWYGLLLALALLLGWRWLEIEAKGTKLAPQVIDLVIWIALSGMIGARLLFVILKWSEFEGSAGAMMNLTQGGLSIHGAILGGAAATFIYCRINKLPVWWVLDMLVPPLILGQIIGRLGNFFNQEAFGGPTDLPWKMWVAPVYRPEVLKNFNFFHPTFLYEMIGLGIILWLIQLVRKRVYSAGSLVLIYFISYSVLRFGIEFFRVDSDKWGQLTVAQWGSLVIIMGGVVIGLILKRRRKLLPLL